MRSQCTIYKFDNDAKNIVRLLNGISGHTVTIRSSVTANMHFIGERFCIVIVSLSCAVRPGLYSIFLTNKIAERSSNPFRNCSSSFSVQVDLPDDRRVQL